MVFSFFSIVISTIARRVLMGISLCAPKHSTLGRHIFTNWYYVALNTGWTPQTALPAFCVMLKSSQRRFSLTARIIFSLSALAASLLAGSGTPVSHPSHDASARYLRPRLLGLGSTFVLAAADQPSPAHSFTPAPGATFALAALTASPFRRSLCLVTSLVAIDSFERRHQREFLRC
jgi:hypothetical protein